MSLKIVLDEIALDFFLSLLKKVNSASPFEDAWIEKDRCVSFAMTIEGQKLKIKLIPKVDASGRLIFNVLKVFAGPLELSGLAKGLDGTINKQLKKAGLDKYIWVDGKDIHTFIKSSFAGITNEEILLSVSSIDI